MAAEIIAADRAGVLTLALFLTSIARSRGSNPWGSTRVAALTRLGDSLYAMHYVCPGIGRVALMDELAAFSNQTARFRDMRRAFIFAGDSCKSVLSELDRPMDRKDTKLLSYGGVYRSSSFPSICCPATAPGRCRCKLCLCRTTAGSLCPTRRRAPNFSLRKELW